ncbi:NB-ARC domain-containing protein [Pontibacter mucosus]|uniref:NB-ARC domain-containing protein n=1 Tax=Pontibacter mucosus TaxID=1649266 RepID=A0A2T5YDS3_9BACT|nr:NB-ARC domain-containing protein [Pontibacter mucosus]PTX14703.1 NB-ARC domain-containing protein [Pontibacter mucosus]
MNYILSQVDKKINFLKSVGQKSELRVHYQSKFEFILTYILAYLWNKNLDRIGLNDTEYIVNSILKPSIGTTVSIIRKLDVDNEFFGNKKLKVLNKFIDNYPNFRNEKIGHGFSFDDDIDNYLDFFDSFFEIIESQNINVIFEEVDLVKITKEEIDVYRGISYKPDGSTYLAWTCPKAIGEFNVDDVYIYLKSNCYIRISPFVLIENESEFYSFCSIEEKLTGRTKYNKLLKTLFITADVPEFEKLSISTDGTKRKSANGTVVNLFENNFKKYIDVGITKRITDFLEKNRSSVFATIWGHGGVGKTASIQRVCEILCNQERKLFDYIIFLSAKDRFYNYYQGKINPINDGISSLEDIVSKINKIIFDTPVFELDPIVNYSGKLLIIIDDFETFTKGEKSRIMSFIKKLDINHHKVVLTTRAATLITGEEIQTKELSEEESITFLREAVKNEIPSFNIEQLQKELKSVETRKKVFEITSGRPLFILQLGIFAAQKGTLTDALNIEIKSTKEAINFLYDRIYDYLSNDAKNMFLAVSLLVDENDLTGLLSNLKFIVSKEEKDEEFQSSLNELVKLKIIVLEDKDLFKVYSPEIYKLMKAYYLNKGAEYDGNITNRFNLINSEKNSPTEVALLENADASRLLDTESEVENKYRYILNREKTPYHIKLTALFNFASYLISHKNKIEKAIKLYQDYYQIFRKDSTYVQNFATCYWAGPNKDSKYKAVKIIQDYLSVKPKINQETYLELLGILTTYKAIIVVSERDELKGKLKFGEITKVNYNYLYKEQKERLIEIFKFPGKSLYYKIKDIDLMTLSPSCRNYVLDGLTHFVEIAIRNNRMDIGREVCKKIFDEMPYNYQDPFIFKYNKIESIVNQDKSESIINDKLTITSDLGLKLKAALSTPKDSQ